MQGARSINWRWCPTCERWLLGSGVDDQWPSGSGIDDHCGTCMGRVEMRMRPEPVRRPRPQVCCEAAMRTRIHCVCKEVWSCEFHGSTHVGTHD